MFPAGLVTATRARFAAAHNDTCDVWRNVGDVSASGGQIDDWRRVYNDSDGRLTGASPSEGIEGAAFVDRTDFTWHCASDMDIRPTDQLVTGGYTYDVIGSDGGRTDALAQHIRLTLTAREDLRG